MIVIGSEAARLGGFLPPWRGERGFAGTGDIDVVCREVELAEIERRLATRAHCRTGGEWLLYDGRHAIDLWVSDAAATLMEDLSGPVVDFAPLGPVQVAPVEVVWATLYPTAGCVARAWEKSFRDLAHYDRMVRDRGLLTPAHWRLAEIYRAKMVAIVCASLEQPPLENHHG
ncbi:hypothetical protein [Sphingomonas nostoxanthinifaciens]|uniref:hypothetical protein n=1 Tax=Sphingomonas nostoxanthinifaciens TaxID=2872652 RepID=UPI001CC21874|nr:hypothetical protein [Sphingomonas nostoxanthinifaciens]UAK25871.1 hypothetical protein K8P63_07050 [Sphingomonas nostoxanthinifaciens]